ncbi:tRNA (guanosine(37)-N1)-methyltransferase TrmD [Sulfoacidibacillus thermotolerans]|uniref:tRNA (guanine-N(1)-)-methyltransferase n=1 Tax=Sulfoacidibacillus thermotolerans TaxID=1765684 RepID=A0A2U3D7U6_SULT2|nr:tRNA (guanosine(37)-N1)-methyltransferase TrmD [Sulfoacidibacillus thermotolerans]PWI57360.1 tRNA (guanosine(37)-N1)-methyltransferase TrmD [Sulfoacidibacillus thermotolerans]
MKVDVLTLFPEMIQGAIDASMMKRAREQGLVDIRLVNFREFSTDRHRTVDDYPFGGGAGMVLKPDPVFAAVDALRQGEQSKPRIVLLTPQGERFSQEKAYEFAHESWMILICGHYEGYDERIREHLATDEISIGDYVLTSGELAAMVVMDAVVRLIPGVLGNQESAKSDSFADGLLEFPQYTRPREFRGWSVPEILVSGNHLEIAKWRRWQSLYRTWQRRPDLLAKAHLTDADIELIKDWTRDADLASRL